MALKKTEVVVDPRLLYDRMLSYKEKHAGWAIFKALYWAIYIFAIGAFLLYVTQSAANATNFNAMQINWAQFVGFALVLLAIFLAIFGLVESLHLKLMKKHG